MHAVARRAREITRRVGAPIPTRVGPAVVAAETGLVHLGRFQLFEPLDVPLRVVIDVLLAWTVAAFAAERGGGRAGILGLPVPRLRHRLRLGVMAENTGIRSGVAGR